MELIQERFNPQRIANLIRIALIDEWRPFILTATVVGCLILFSGLLFRSVPQSFLLNMMLLIGLVQVSRIFSEIHHKEKGIAFFMTPASLEEKYLLKLVSSLVFYYLFTLFVCFVANRLAILITGLLYDSVSLAKFEPLQSRYFDKFKLYLFFHALFFTGALFFKRSSFLKTAFTVTTIFFVLALSAGTFLKNAFLQASAGQQGIYFQFNNVGDLYRAFGMEMDTYFTIIEIGMFIVLPVLLYGLSFLRFRKAEIRG